eukprot:g5372.t1
MTSVLRSRVKALEVEVNHANGLLQTRLSSLKSLKETAAKRKRTIKGLRSDLKQATRKNALLEQRLEEIAQLQQFVANERDEVHASAARAEEAARKRIEGLLQSIEGLTADVEQARTRESHLMEATKRMEDSLAQANLEIGELKSTIEQCKESHKETLGKLDSQKQNNEALRQENIRIKEQIAHLESRMEGAVAMLQAK